MRAKLLRLRTFLAIAVVAWCVARGPSFQARAGDAPKPLVPVPATQNGTPAAPTNGNGVPAPTENGNGVPAPTENGNGVPVPAVNGNGVVAYPPGAYNYYVHPGEAGLVGAQLYLSPRPTPPLVGHTYITYPPLLPHEFLYHHHRVYRTYNPGSGVTRTRVHWN